MNFFLEQIVSLTNHKHCNFVLTLICIIPMLQHTISRIYHLQCKSPLFLAFYVCYSTWGFNDFLEEENLFPRFVHALLLLQKIQSNTKLVSIRLGALSSLFGTLLDLGLPHAAPLQGESLGTNQLQLLPTLEHHQHFHLLLEVQLARHRISSHFYHFYHFW